MYKNLQSSIFIFCKNNKRVYCTLRCRRQITFLINFFKNIPDEALLFKSSGSLFHLLRSAYDGRYSNEAVFKMYLNFRENCLVPINVLEFWRFLSLILFSILIYFNNCNIYIDTYISISRIDNISKDCTHFVLRHFSLFFSHQFTVIPFILLHWSNCT